MDNEIISILLELKDGQNKLLLKVDNLENRFNSLEHRFNSLENRFDSLEKEVKSIGEKTAELLEFKTYTILKLDSISNDISFVKHKLHVTEEDMFTIKNILDSPR